MVKEKTLLKWEMREKPEFGRYFSQLLLVIGFSAMVVFLMYTRGGPLLGVSIFCGVLILLMIPGFREKTVFYEITDRGVMRYSTGFVWKLIIPFDKFMSRLTGRAYLSMYKPHGTIDHFEVHSDRIVIKLVGSYMKRQDFEMRFHNNKEKVVKLLSKYADRKG